MTISENWFGSAEVPAVEDHRRRRHHTAAIIDGKPVTYPDDMPVSLPRDRGQARVGEGSRGTYKVHAYRPRGARKAQWARVRQALCGGPRTHIDLRRAGGDALALLDAATLGDWAQRGLIERGEDRMWRLGPAGRAA